MKNTIFIILIFSSFVGCSQKGFQVEQGVGTTTPPPTEVEDSPVTNSPQTTKTDFVAGEVVTTSTGFVIRGAFGEITEKKKLANGVEIEGTFYE